MKGRKGVNGQLYDMCRAGSDPAITRALEEKKNPLAKMRRKLTNLTVGELEETVLEAWEEDALWTQDE